MGLFESIFGNKPKAELKEAETLFRTLTAYAPVYRSWNGKLYESALVRSAIDARARHISKLKVEFLGPSKNKMKTALKHKPNSFMTWSQFLYRTSTILDIHNTAFIVPIFDDYGEVCGIYPALPTSCKVLQSKGGRAILEYTFTDRSTARCWMSECAVLTKFQYDNDFFGSSNNALNETMDLISIQNQGITEAVKNSSTYRFMAKVNNFSKAEDLKKERERFNSTTFSKENSSGGLLLFPNSYADIKQIDSKPYTVDAEQRKLIENNVYSYYAVNEDVLQSKTVGDGWNAFYESAVETFAIQFSEVVTNMLFTSIEQSNGASVMASSNRLQYMSNQDKLNVSSQLLDRGIFSINEVRDIWNLPSVEGGDKRIIRGEYYTVDKDGNKEESK